MYTEWDNGNPVWEDKLLDPNDPLIEIIWQKDKKCNKEADPIDIDENLTAKGTGMYCNLSQTLITITFYK